MSELVSPVLLCRDLVKTYPSGAGRLTVLDGVNLELATGELLAVTGASGVGKSTLLHLLGGLDRPDAGHVVLEGIDLADLGPDERARLRNRRVGHVFQFHHLLPEFTAEENVLMPFSIARADPVEARHRVKEILGDLGLAGRSHHFPAELSGGEQQRVALARALAPEPAVVLADEPTGNLDPRTAEQVIDRLWKVHEHRRFSLVLVTHSPELARRCDRIVHLTERGRFAPDRVEIVRSSRETV
ncbi:MAG: ABC transporter ATP-binding protein [Acidobacteriota bacterium]